MNFNIQVLMVWVLFIVTGSKGIIQMILIITQHIFNAHGYIVFLTVWWCNFKALDARNVSLKFNFLPDNLNNDVMDFHGVCDVGKLLHVVDLLWQWCWWVTWWSLCALNHPIIFKILIVDILSIKYVDRAAHAFAHKFWN